MKHRNERPSITWAPEIDEEIRDAKEKTKPIESMNRTGRREQVGKDNSLPLFRRQSTGLGRSSPNTEFLGG
jgi:hypothetical protein